MQAKDKLRATWSKKEKDVMLHFPLGESTQSDAHFLSGVFNQKFIDSMRARGYDITTLKFEISPAAKNPRFASTRPPT